MIGMGLENGVDCQRADEEHNHVMLGGIGNICRLGG